MWAAEGHHFDKASIATFGKILDGELPLQRTGTSVRHCELLTPADEAQLWTSRNHSLLAV